VSEGKHIRFHQLLETHLNSIIQKRFVNRALTPEMMREMRNAIHETIGGVFAKSSHKLSANALTWLGDQYFKAIKINDDQLMSDTVVINEYTLTELEFNDIQLLRNLFSGTRMGPELNEELQRRSVS
jgi:hypothetical protein